jgi:DeoR/GlpR family transcriptional regulator of sugar metabolism
MARRLYRRERFEYILRELDSNGYAAVGDLAEVLGVSAVTVRADLDALEQEGALIRTHGGAVPVPLEGGRYSFAVRRGIRVPAKERIGAYAASLIQDGEAIVMDASTTSWHVAHRLDEKRDITVITNGLHVALELLRWPGVAVMMPGGPLWRSSSSSALKAQRIETPSVGLWRLWHPLQGLHGGSRRSADALRPRSKIADAAQVHRYTGVCPVGGAAHPLGQGGRLW